MRSHLFGLNRSLGLAILVIALVALLGNVLVLTAVGRLQTATEARGVSNATLLDLAAFEAAMLDQETGLRGYLLTGRPASLAPYYAGRAQFDAVTGRLRAEIVTPAQRALFDDAERAARDWQRSIGEIAARDMADPARRDAARALEATGLGKERFDRFRRSLAAIAAREMHARDRQDAIVRQSDSLATLTLWLSALVTLAICLAAGLTISLVVVRPLVKLAETMRRLVRRDTDVEVPSIRQRNEVGEMARAVDVFRSSLIELDRTSVLRVTADTLPAMVGYIGADRRVGLLNGEFARWFDLGVDDVAMVYGKPLELVFTGRAFPGAGAELTRALAGEEMRFACQLADRDGVPHDIEADFRPHRAPDGAVLGVVTLLTDVSDRKNVDRRLRHQAHDLQRSNAELEQFAYVASHDLKAPLRGIENLASWIEEDLADRLVGEPRTNMTLLKSRVRRLERLLDDLLAYSRAGRDDTVVRETDSRALVEELAVLISPPAGFTIVAAPSLPTLRAAHAALTQVLQNLIGNAVKHHPDPARGHVWVDAARTGNEYEFRVADDGAGIPEQYRDRVFGMFQTLKPRDEVEGSGMGLAIVRKLVERQAGKVWLSARAGGGLIVHFTWPAAAAEISR